MSLDVLPLAITMVIGPRLLAGIILVTSERALPSSFAYVLGFGLMVAIGVTVFRGVAALLVFASIKQYLGRETAEPPK